MAALRSYMARTWPSSAAILSHCRFPCGSLVDSWAIVQHALDVALQGCLS